MIKKIIIVVVLVAVVGLPIFGAVNRTLAKNGDNASGPGVSGYNHEENGQGRSGGQGGLANESETFNLLPTISGNLDANETAALLYMREEEKLAHDVYLTLSTQWGLPIFQNISRSEQTHTDAVKTLIEHYNLSDPALTTIGKFTNPDLQALFESLVTRGSQSLSEALKVGAAIEEIDILDLDKYLSQTDNTDIQQVFTNLKYGSYNHLSAFTTTLYRQTGEIYQPQYLSPDAYQAVMESTGNSSGNGGKGSGGGYRGGRP
jgi:hypothetical protein